MRSTLKLMAMTLLLAGWPAYGADNPVSPESGAQVIQPQIDRRDIVVPKIKARDFEWTVYLGQYNAESFGAQPVYGTRLGYHLSEDFFAEFALAKSSISDANFRHLGIAIFSEEVTELMYYNVSAGFNLFPGELFLGRGRAWGSTLYVIGGVGVTSFDTFDRVTLSYGLGLRILPFKRVSLRMELREHTYESDLLGENRYLRNLELTGGLAIVF